MSKRSRMSSFIPPYMYAAVDPHDAEAQGARLPDESCYPAIPFTSTLRATLVSNTGGSGAIACSPLWAKATKQPSVAVAPDGTTDWNTSPTYNSVTQYTAITNNFELGRHVGWGVKLVANSAISITSGMIYAAYVPADYTGSNFPVNLPSTPDAIVAMPFSTAFPASMLNEEAVVFTARRLDVSSTRYRDVSYGSQAGLESSDGWGVWVFILTGASTTTTTSILVELIYRDEFTPKPTSIVGIGQVYPTDSQAMDVLFNTGAKLPVLMREPETPGLLATFVDAARRRGIQFANAAGVAAVNYGAMLGGRAVSNLVTNWVREAAGGRTRPLLLRNP